jgi:hypothetical protein
MRVGVQFTGDLEPNQTRRWFTMNWPETWHVAWYVMPITPALGAPEVECDVAVERADPQHVTYWITVKNLTGQPVNFEARYAVLN